MDSTDLDAQALDPYDAGVYVYGEGAALHVGFQGPGWNMRRDRQTGYVYTLVDFCSPGRIRLAFGAPAGADEMGEPVYDWGRNGWGGDGHCLSNSLGDEKPRFYLSARQAAEIIADPQSVHKYDFSFVGWRGDQDGCPLQDDEERKGGVTMTKSLTWTPIPRFGNGSNGGAGKGPPSAVHLYRLSLSLSCSDGFQAEARVDLDAADYLLLSECVRFAIPHLLGLHGAFRLPNREDYAQDNILSVDP